MFESASLLCGIYKVNNSASCVVINPRKLAMGAKHQQGESFGRSDGGSVGRSVGSEEEDWVLFLDH